ncbi:MAG: UMP kinase [Planctomycetota bacterium]|nr:MAG: UMP kinase [Planctomycetota bacterium]
MAYSSILLKLSGEALGADEGHALEREAIETIARQIRAVTEQGVRVAVVVGGGNILRGADVADTISVPATADQMGMLATMINGLALMDGLERHGMDARLMSAIWAEQICEPFIRRRAMRHQEKGRVVILAGGTGNPHFTTDTTAALRANELGCDVVLKATKVDGIYDKDPAKHSDAKRYEHLTYRQVIEQDLRVMDLTAITMCMDHDLPIQVFDVFTEGNLERVVRGETLGTTVTKA